MHLVIGICCLLSASLLPNGIIRIINFVKLRALASGSSFTNNPNQIIYFLVSLRPFNLLACSVVSQILRTSYIPKGHKQEVPIFLGLFAKPNPITSNRGIRGRFSKNNMVFFLLQFRRTATACSSWLRRPWSLSSS